MSVRGETPVSSENEEIIYDPDYFRQVEGILEGWRVVSDGVQALHPNYSNISHLLIAFEHEVMTFFHVEIREQENASAENFEGV